MIRSLACLAAPSRRGLWHSPSTTTNFSCYRLVFCGLVTMKSHFLMGCIRLSLHSIRRAPALCHECAGVQFALRRPTAGGPATELKLPRTFPVNSVARMGVGIVHYCFPVPSDLGRGVLTAVHWRSLSCPSVSSTVRLALNRTPIPFAPSPIPPNLPPNG